MTWNKFKIRNLTEEEKKDFPEYTEAVWEKPVPNIGEDILVSDGKTIWIDNWCDVDDGVELVNAQKTEGLYWMPLPKLP